MRYKFLFFLIIISFFSINSFSQGLLNDLSPERAIKIRELIAEMNRSAAVEYDEMEERGYIDSDNWQVVRIIAVASETDQVWDYVDRYDTSTPADHSGAWLLVATEEQAFQPLNGFIDAEGKFRYYTATELVQDRVDISDGIYTGFRRFWYVERTITSGDFKFTADYANCVTPTNCNQVHLHRDIFVR